ncbi:MAG: heme/hemin ABC transporter substrate-binding protein [Flammeovirgaceae bacterium]
MKHQAIIYLFMGAVLCLTSCNKETQEPIANEVKQPKRLITAGGAITEVVNKLGFGDQIIATDKTSTYPTHMQELPSIGYRNNITAEGLISLNPDAIILEEGYLEPEIIQQLEATGIELKQINNEKTIAGAKQLITELASYLGAKSIGESLIKQIDVELEQAQIQQQMSKEKPKVLFVYARGHGTLNIGGTGTFAQEMVKLAGGELAVPEIEGYKPLTTEALVKANPDYILFFNSGLKTLNGVEGALEIPGIEQTTAGKQKNIIALDGLLLSGFDSRVGNAVLQLSQLIHPKES